MEFATHWTKSSDMLNPPHTQPVEIMLVSQGHGRGHAVPDMAIATALKSAEPDVNIQFVSYAAGAEAYRACGYHVLDLHKPDTPPFLDMVIAFTKLFAQAKPQLIVAHEEIPALPVAKAFEIPCIFITDFFADPSNLAMWALRYADEVIFTAQRGLFTEPPYLKGKVYYVGRAVRRFDYTPADIERARCELGIPQDAIVVLCQPGAWVESQIPLTDLLDAAWKLVVRSPKRLIWLAGRDYQALATRFQKEPEITVLKEDWKIDRLMAASDVLITKANRVTVYEAAAMGLPSISISNLMNWPDDVAVAGVDSNTAISGDSVTPERLSELILEKAGSKPPVAATELSGGVAGAAARIAHHLVSLQQSTPASRWRSAPTKVMVCQ